MNATLAKFGYPQSLIRDYRHWSVLLRPAQVTLGSLVLGAKSEERAFSDLPAAAFGELQAAVSHIERGLRAFRPFDRLNYLMLMMVDPHVHFHVIPRYQSTQTFEEIAFTDAGWPGAPDLKSATEVSEPIRATLLRALQQCWPKA